MRKRVFIGVGAWVVGAGVATGGSLLAVSLLGQGITSSPSEQLSGSAVNNALASGTSATPAGAGPSASPRGAKSSSKPRAAAPGSRSSAVPASAGSTVLTSSGGTVVASCLSAGAFLRSWSPGARIPGQLLDPRAGRYRTGAVRVRHAGSDHGRVLLRRGALGHHPGRGLWRGRRWWRQLRSRRRWWRQLRSRRRGRRGGERRGRAVVRAVISRDQRCDQRSWSVISSMTSASVGQASTARLA